MHKFCACFYFKCLFRIFDDIVGKEDDHLRKEDDTKEISVSSRKDDLKEASITGRQETRHHQDIAGVGQQPPPPPLRLVEKSLPIRGDNNVDISGRIRAGNIGSEGIPNGSRNTITAENSKTSHIMVNGVRLVDLPKLRKVDNTRKATGSRKKEGRGSKSDGRTTPSSDMRGKLLKYLVRKKPANEEDISDNKGTISGDNKSREEDENNSNNLTSQEGNKPVEEIDVPIRKLTFTPPHQKRVKDNIRMFELSPSVGGSCLFARGRCTNHGVKLIRRVGVKKVSVIDKNGQLSWQMREVTNLACPSLDISPGSDVIAKDYSSLSGGTNKKRKIVSHGGEDQLEPSSTTTVK